jgi:hypothetical protein
MSKVIAKILAEELVMLENDEIVTIIKRGASSHPK